MVDMTLKPIKKLKYLKKKVIADEFLLARSLFAATERMNNPWLKKWKILLIVQERNTRSKCQDIFVKCIEIIEYITVIKLWNEIKDFEKQILRQPVYKCQ